VVFTLRLPEKESTLLLILALVYLLSRLPPMVLMPLVQDEAVYSMMIGEQASHFTMIPTWFGYPMSWKPAPFFWAYAVFYKLLSGLPLEVIFRFPSFLFGLLTVPVLFHLLRNLGASRNLAFFSVLIFLLSYPSVYPNATLLTDSLLFLLMSSSLYLYTDKRFGDFRFAGAAALVFAAFFIKLFIAFMVPLLAVAYFYQADRKTLRRPVFLLSLLAVPLAFILQTWILQSSGLAEEAYLSDVGGHLVSKAGLLGQLQQLVGSLNVFVSSCGIWFALSLFGVWKHWKENKFMTFWYALLILPVLTGFFMPWYYLPVMPAVAYFTATALLVWNGKEKPDAFFTIFFSLALFFTVVLTIGLYLDVYGDFVSQKEAGLLLAGKENVAIIGTYAPGILAYKITTEKRENLDIDVGWVLIHPAMLSANSTELVDDFVLDYRSEKHSTIDGSFSKIFMEEAIFRKDTNITQFDYFVLVGSNTTALQNATVLYNQSSIVIYKVR